MIFYCFEIFKHVKFQFVEKSYSLCTDHWAFHCCRGAVPIDSGFFLHSLTKIIDNFAIKYDNHLIMGDFNMESNNPMFKSFQTAITLQI